MNTKNRVLEPTNSAAAVATGMYLAGLRRVPGLRGILGAAPPHPSPGPDGRGRRGRAGVGGAGWTRRRTRGCCGGSGRGEGNPTPRAARRQRADVSAPLKVDREARGAGLGGEGAGPKTWEDAPAHHALFRKLDAGAHPSPGPRAPDPARMVELDRPPEAS